jgi:heme/copper-type cytochrome/quinol oxidase subunit 1
MAGSTTCRMRRGRYNPGLNQDFYALGMVFLGISTTVGAANFMVTALRTRAPGMSINRLPIMVWGTLTASAANLIVVPAVSLAFFLLWMDRQFGTHFFDPVGRRAAAAVAALILDLRASVGVRHRAACDGHGVGWLAGVLSAAAWWVFGGGACRRWRP